MQLNRLDEQPGGAPREEKEEEFDWQHVEDNERLLGYANGPPSLARLPRPQALLARLPPASALPSLLASAGRRLGFFLVPSFIQARLRPDASKASKLHPSAYLDGMRGVAALLVFFCHLTYSCHEVHHGWGFVPAARARADAFSSLWRLPVVRLLYAGEPMVFVFFVVSGYALSVKPLRQMRGGDRAGLHDTLVSAAFRRGLRLYLPCLASTLFTALVVQLGVYELTRGVEVNRALLTNWHELHPAQLEGGLWAQLAHWAGTVWEWWQPFVWVDVYTHPDYDEHLWTIPVEFWASMNLFVSQIALAACKPRLRMAIVAAIMALAVAKNCWPVLLFHGGMLIAELEQSRPAASAPAEPSAPAPSDAPLQPSSPAPRRGPWTPLWIAGFALGLFLMSQPGLDSDRTPFWVTLAALVPAHFTPARRFWPCFGALLLAYCTSRSPALKRLFENRVSQYLGRLSFSLYLMQAWVIHTVAYGAFGFFWGVLGADGAAKEAGFVLGAAVSLPVIFWAADVFWRAVDLPSVRFARWLERVCFVS